VRYSAVSKGEVLQDTIRTLEAYADVIVLRHPEVGSAALACRICP
jgi:aspartate carbamoyltransferase catalytic subunit